MLTSDMQHAEATITRELLVALLNEDLAGEYQSVISYVIYSQIIASTKYMTIAAELELHAAEELSHALIIARHIDGLGGVPLAAPKPVRTSTVPEEMLRFDLENEDITIARYRKRVEQCEVLGEYALADQLRDILVQEENHRNSLLTALSITIPEVTQIQRGQALQST